MESKALKYATRMGVLSEGMMDVSLTESGRPWERAWGECKREAPEEDGKEHKHT
jgi:hypothetical protein